VCGRGDKSWKCGIKDELVCGGDEGEEEFAKNGTKLFFIQLSIFHDSLISSNVMPYVCSAS
jgi:hypothetical protein